MPDEQPSLHGRVALVTGSSRGIGQAVALALAKHGCSIAVNYRTSAQKADEVVRQIKEMGREAVAIQADVANPHDVARLVSTTESQLGPIDILVNNAGINPIHPLETIGEHEWHSVLNANLTSAFLVSQAVVPGMRRRRWGRLIMFSSIAAQTGGVIGPHYAASKAGLLGLVHSYAKLLATDGVTANAIAPALIETDMIRSNPNVTPSLIPVQRFGTVEEVADVAVLLATNGYITGQTINVNGGWYMS